MQSGMSVRLFAVDMIDVMVAIFKAFGRLVCAKLRQGYTL